LFPELAFAQYQAPSEQLLVQAHSASTWRRGDGDVIALQGAVRIELDRAVLTGGRAVIWLTPAGEGDHPIQHAEIALLDDIKVEQKLATRSGQRLLVTADVRGTIRLTVDDRADRDESALPLYVAADALRQTAAAPPVAQPAVTSDAASTSPSAPQVATAATQPEVDNARPPDSRPAAELRASPHTQPATPDAFTPAPRQPQVPTTTLSPDRPQVGLPSQPQAIPYEPQPTAYTPKTGLTPAPAQPTTKPAPQIIPVYFEFQQMETVPGEDGKVRLVLTGNVMLFQRRPNGDTIELRAERAVLFTPLKSLKELQKTDRSRGGRPRHLHAQQL
jgi:hypothetical protein